MSGWKHYLMIFLFFTLAGLAVRASVSATKWRGFEVLHKSVAGINTQNNSPKPIMKITSSVFKNQERVPDKYTCAGLDINPPLDFNDVPADAETLAVIMDDPDAPDGVWTHWTVWNLTSDTKGIAEGAESQIGVQGITSSGGFGYHGPCPPSGTHHYVFRLYALDQSLDLPASSTENDLRRAMAGHTLAQAELVGLYSKD